MFSKRSGPRTRRRNVFASLCSGLLLASAAIGSANAATGQQDLAVVKPVMACEDLTKANITAADGSKVIIKTAALRETAKGPYCRVTGGTIHGIGFAGDLPMTKWTQRFLQGAQGREGIQRAGSCMPALNGEIAVVTEAGGTGTGEDDALKALWGVPPQARINAAYLGQHMTAVAFKGVIKAFYGQAPRYSYLVGCSGGGGTSLTNAQRYPEDFDGYSIGAPPLYLASHDTGFWHGWEYQANQRADGTVVLAKEKLPILHAAAIKNCASVSGIIDGTLQMPTLCTFKKSWVQCAPAAADTSQCLTPEEANVAEQLYLGPNDGKGNFFDVSGFPLGSELLWRLSTTGKPADNEGFNPRGVHSFIMPPLSGKSTKEIMADFAFSQSWYDKTVELQPMFNAGNTNLRPLEKLGHKIILWNGAEDTLVPPAGTIAYYNAVRQDMGARLADNAIRFFLVAGMGHCGGGDGANQIDVLTPLMAWVETNNAPTEIVAGRPVPVERAAAGGGGGQQAPGAVPNYPPYAEPDGPTVYTRPVYNFPSVAKYSGKGDQKVAANYVRAPATSTKPQTFTSQVFKTLGSNNQKWYRAEGDKLLATTKN